MSAILSSVVSADNKIMKIKAKRQKAKAGNDEDDKNDQSGSRHRLQVLIKTLGVRVVAMRL
jgi:hypothetical protein